METPVQPTSNPSRYPKDVERTEGLVTYHYNIPSTPPFPPMAVPLSTVSFPFLCYVNGPHMENTYRISVQLPCFIPSFTVAELKQLEKLVRGWVEQVEELGKTARMR